MSGPTATFPSSCSWSKSLNGGRNHIYLVDVHSLGARAITTEGRFGMTLRHMLQSNTANKIFFDVRNESAALYAHYSIKLEHVIDVQVMELARHTTEYRKRLRDIERCIDDYARLRHRVSDREAAARWREVRRKGALLVRPEQGGSPAVFNERPLRPEVVDYCVARVQYLPTLLRMYSGPRAELHDWDRSGDIRKKTKYWVRQSQRKDYDPRNLDMAKSPHAHIAERKAIEAAKTSAFGNKERGFRPHFWSSDDWLEFD